MHDGVVIHMCRRSKTKGDRNEEEGFVVLSQVDNLKGHILHLDVPFIGILIKR